MAIAMGRSIHSNHAMVSGGGGDTGGRPLLAHRGMLLSRGSLHRRFHACHGDGITALGHGLQSPLPLPPQHGTDNPVRPQVDIVERPCEGRSGGSRTRPASRCSERFRFALDSPLEQAGFEPSVPLKSQAEPDLVLPYDLP